MHIRPGRLAEMAKNQAFQWWAKLPANIKTLSIAAIVGIVVIAGVVGLYEMTKHGTQGQIDFAPANETVTCSDQATNPGFNFPITLTNPGNKPVYWSVTYAPSKSTSAIRNFQFNRMRVTLGGGSLLIAGTQNTIPAGGQATINVLGYVDEAWTLTFSYSGDSSAITPQSTTFNLTCSS
jgi:hypothetical protein